MTAAVRSRLFTYGVVIPFAIVLAFPFVWMVVTSIHRQDQVFDPTKTWRFSPSLAGWRFLFENTKYLTWLGNTVLVGLIVVVITLALALPAGYAIARLTGRVGQTLGVAMFLTYLVPPTLLFLPLSNLVARLGLQDRPSRCRSRSGC